LTHSRHNFSFGFCFLDLRNVKGLKHYYNRIYRIDRALELNIETKLRSRLARRQPKPITVRSALNESWQMSFKQDEIADRHSPSDYLV